MTQHLKFCSRYACNQCQRTNTPWLSLPLLSADFYHPKQFGCTYPQWHNHLGLPDPTSNNASLHLTLRGLDRTLPLVPSRPQRRPITTSVLQALLAKLQQTTFLSKHDRFMLKAAFLVAFFGFLRVSNFTQPDRKQFSLHHYPVLSGYRPPHTPSPAFQNRPTWQRLHSGHWLYSQ